MNKNQHISNEKMSGDAVKLASMSAPAPASASSPKRAKKQKRKGWLRRNMSTIIVVLVLILGLAILAYPSFSDWWNTSRNAAIISNYDEQVSSLSNSEKERMWQEAVEWNEWLVESGHGISDLTDAQEAEYNQLLYVLGSPAMGYIEIPTIRCRLPIYHGTDDSALQTGIGHLEWSSLPVGGESTHCVISGHRGLPSAQLFTRLDELVEGDVFMLKTLDTTLTYEVDQILIVEPDEVGSLGIVEGQDLCTLVTCTPYGVNTHRLLIRGHRIANLEDVPVPADALQIDKIIVAACVAVPLLVVLFGVAGFGARRRKRARERMQRVRRDMGILNSASQNTEAEASSMGIVPTTSGKIAGKETSAKKTGKTTR